MNTKIQQIIPSRTEIEIDQIQVLNSRDFELLVFDERCIHFLNRISVTINSHKNLRNDAAIVALGFWLRKSNVQKIVKENQHLVETNIFKVSPIGTVFHICPANVDTMFLYSLALSLLMGNKNILRVSARTDIENVRILFDTINEVMAEPEFLLFKNYLSIVNYEHNNDINIYFSNYANARILWGGDQTVNLFKSYAVKSKIKDIVFPDRKSFALFNTKVYNALTDTDKQSVVKKFYNDAYSFDQKGCSSPQCLFVLGKKADITLFKTDFYNRLIHIAENNYTNDITSLASLKFNQLTADVLETENQFKNVTWQNNFTYFVETDKTAHLQETCGGGYFYIIALESLENIVSHISREVQTITYFGLSQNDCEQLFKLSFGKGIDRIVPVGTALNFDYIWDGYNIPDELCVKKKII